MIKLKRNNSQYLAVEKFKDYELTYCIAYEMAIRNDEVIKSIYNFYNNYVNYDIYDCYVLSTDDFKKCYSDAQKLMEFFINPINLYLDYHIYNNINEHVKKVKEEDIKENSDFFTRGLRRILYKPIEDYYHEEIKPSEKIVIYKNTSLYTEFISHLKNDDNTITIHHNSITPNYSRPLTLDFKDTKERNIILNLNLPTNELVDFIERFKRKYDNNPTIVKSVSELLNKEFKETVTKLPSIQNRYADMFFIYDCFKLGLTATKIQRKIDKYYEDKDPTSKTISINTINKYNKIAIEYIDNLKYKHLVT